MADSIRDLGDGTFHYNGKTYYNKNDAEKDRYYDINKEYVFKEAVKGSNALKTAFINNVGNTFVCFFQ